MSFFFSIRRSFRMRADEICKEIFWEKNLNYEFILLYLEDITPRDLEEVLKTRPSIAFAPPRALSQSSFFMWDNFKGGDRTVTVAREKSSERRIVASRFHFGRVTFRASRDFCFASVVTFYFRHQKLRIFCRRFISSWIYIISYKHKSYRIIFHRVHI